MTSERHSKTQMRFALIGAHLREEDIAGVSGVEPVLLEKLTLSSIAYDPAAGLADPHVIATASRVRSELLARETFVAIRYGTSVTGPSDALEKCRQFAATWSDLLERCRGTVEMTLKIAGSRASLRPDRMAFASGRAYLEELHRSRSSSSVPPPFRDAVEKRLGEPAVRWRWVRRDDGGLELAFLALRGSLPSIREAGLELKADFPDVPFLLSGPWPLEVFADGD